MFHPSVTIRARVVDGLLVVLDLASDQYSVLDEIGTAFWLALTSLPDHEACLAALGETFDAPSDILERDLSEFSNRCVKARWLTLSPQREDQSRPALNPSSPTAFRAWLTLLSVATMLWTRGLLKTYVACSRLNSTTHRQGTLERALQGFLSAENLVVLPRAPSDCLPRSLALFAFLRRCGIDCHHVIGVQRTPFLAHAWVEVGNEPVLERLDHCHFHVLARL